METSITMQNAFEAEVNVDALAGDLETIRDYLRWAVSRFTEANLYYGHGTDCPWDEALHLVLQGLYLPLDIDQKILDAKLTHVERQKIIQWVYRRVVDRIPLPYLTKTAWFAGMKFYVDERVIVPRSPIGELIRHHFTPWIDIDSIHHMLDLCTGSGCIGIASAYVFKKATIVLSDISDQALEVAKRNIQEHGLQDRLKVILSDIFQQLPNQKFDLIIANPPYVDADGLSTMPREFLKEPVIALGSGQDGLDITCNILSNACDYLTENGTLIVEVGDSQHALRQKFPEVPFTWIHFEDGGDGVFLLNYENLLKYRAIFNDGKRNAR